MASADQFLMRMMSLLPHVIGKGGGRGGQTEETQWKIRFHETLKKKGIDEKPTYAAVATEGNKDFLGTVTVQGQHFAAEEAAIGKKHAEQAAAKAAFRALFPEEFAALEAGGGGMMEGAAVMANMFMGMMGGRGQKRKDPDDQTAKSKLHHGVQLLIKFQCSRCTTKADIVYGITENEGDTPNKRKSYMATVTIPEYEGGKSFSGEWVDAKPKAEESAAQAALDAMGDTFRALHEQHVANKKAKHAAEAEAKAAKRAAKHAT